jgi:4-hydroxy-3-polyprenylbenzoate decarboxylase
MTGASGSIYGQRLVECLVGAGVDVQLTISPAAAQVIAHELSVKVDVGAFEPRILWPDVIGIDERLTYFHYQDFTAPPASGSHLTGGMAVCPCSGGTLSGIARGASSNLIERAAEVHLKEQRKLVLVPRETPLSLAYIHNLRDVARAGAVVLPASPGFYHGPSSIGDLVDFVVARVLDQLSIEHTLVERWGAAEVRLETE